MTRTEPPSGVNPPQAFELADGTEVDLGPIARRLCGRYYDNYPDDLERYGPTGEAWCEHDSRYMLAWALEDARAGSLDCVAQVQWLGRVLAGRAFPIPRLVRHVELTAEILRSSELGNTGQRAADRMSQAAIQLKKSAVEADNTPSDTTNLHVATLNDAVQTVTPAMAQAGTR